MVILALLSTLSGQNCGPYIRNPVYWLFPNFQIWFCTLHSPHTAHPLFLTSSLHAFMQSRLGISVFDQGYDGPPLHSPLPGLASNPISVLSVSGDDSGRPPPKQPGMEAIERLRFLASFGLPSTGKIKGGEKTQPFNRFHSHPATSTSSSSSSLSRSVALNDVVEGVVVVPGRFGESRSFSNQVTHFAFLEHELLLKIIDYLKS